MLELLALAQSAHEFLHLLRLALVRQHHGVVGLHEPGAGTDVEIRTFFPGTNGLTEDPVTGSAHCALGPYWQARLGKDDLVGYQASPRGGTVRVSCRGERVRLAGTAVTVVRGELLLPA